MKNLNPLIFLFTALVLGACHSNQAPVNNSIAKLDSLIKPSTSRMHTSDSSKNAIGFDSIKADSLVHILRTHLKTYTFYYNIPSRGDYLPPVSPRQWSDGTAFFGVYRFSDSVIGIGFDMQDDHSYYESLFSTVDIKDPKVIKQSYINQTQPEKSLLHSDTLKSLFFRNDTTRYFYVYCTKGVAVAKITDVYFNSFGCVAFIAIRLSNIDPKVYGEPVIASKQKINVNYSVNKEFQHDLNVSDSINNITNGSKDIQLSIQFASNDSLFFTYNDDFSWWKPGNLNYTIPDRTIYKHNKKTTMNYWSAEIGMTAQSCD